MINELAHFALILAFAVAIAQTIIPLIGAHKGWRGWMAMAQPAATSQFILVGFAFAVVFEVSADIQKAVWVKAGRVGGFCKVGVWKFSR